MAKIQIALPQLPSQVVACLTTIRNAHFEVYVVGGSVRDMIIHSHSENKKALHSIKDWDFTTNATPEDILKLFPHAKYENTFGTVIIPVKGHQEKNATQDSEDTFLFEITPYRNEDSYKDNRHPENITWAQTIEEDLKRRDFTINALAYDDTDHTVIDLNDGLSDIQNKIIRAVGNANTRFEEDALRIMRAVRFSAQLNFTIEPHTFEAIKTHVTLLDNISKERIRDEFLKILASDNPAEGVMILRHSGILKHILPEFDRCFDVDQKSPNRHHEFDVGTHSVEALRACPSKDPITRFATLLHDIGKATTREIDPETKTVTFYNHEIEGAQLAHYIAKRFRLSKKDSIKLTKLVRYHMFSVQEEQTDKSIRRFIRKVGKNLVNDILDLRIGDRLGSGVPETSWRTELFKKRIIEVQKQPFEIRDLKISGEEVMKELSIGPGPKVGEVLKTLFGYVEDGTIKNTKKELLTALKQLK